MSGAAILVGLVIAADGDTLTLLDDQHRRVKVRLAAIDAPEKKQPYGGKGQDSLGHSLLPWTVSLEEANPAPVKVVSIGVMQFTAHDRSVFLYNFRLMPTLSS